MERNTNSIKSMLGDCSMDRNTKPTGNIRLLRKHDGMHNDTFNHTHVIKMWEIDDVVGQKCPPLLSKGGKHGKPKKPNQNLPKC